MKKASQELCHSMWMIFLDTLTFHFLSLARFLVNEDIRTNDIHP